MKRLRLWAVLTILALAVLTGCGRTDAEPTRGEPVGEEYRIDSAAAEPAGEPDAQAPDVGSPVDVPAAAETPAQAVTAVPENEDPAAPASDDAVENGEILPIVGTDESADEEEAQRSADGEEAQDEGFLYVLNTNTKKIHNPWCSSVARISPQNYQETSRSVEELEAEGYTKCGQNGDWK